MAYVALGIDNGASCADGDVGVAFYKNLLETGELSTFSLNALQCIADARRSQFLDFLATIVGHLNEKDITVLARRHYWPRRHFPRHQSQEMLVKNSLAQSRWVKGRSMKNALRILPPSHPKARWRWMLLEESTRLAKIVHLSSEAPLHRKHPYLPAMEWVRTRILVRRSVV